MAEQTCCNTPVVKFIWRSEWLNRHVATLQRRHPFVDQDGWTDMLWHSSGDTHLKIKMVEQTCCDTPLVTPIWRSDWLNRHVWTLQWLHPFEDQNGWTDMLRHSGGYTHLKIRMVEQTCCDTPVATPIWRSKWLNIQVATLYWRHSFEDQNGWTDMLWHSSGDTHLKIKMVEQTCCDTPVATPIWRSKWMNIHVATLHWQHPFEDQNVWRNMSRHSSGYTHLKIKMVEQTWCDIPLATPIWRSEWLNKHVATLHWRHPFEDQNGWRDMSRHSSGYTHLKIKMVEETCRDIPVATPIWRSKWLKRHVATLQWLHPLEDQNGWRNMSRHSSGYTHLKIKMVEQTCHDTPVATPIWRSKWLKRHVVTLQWLHLFEDQNGWTDMWRHSSGYTLSLFVFEGVDGK